MGMGFGGVTDNGNGDDQIVDCHVGDGWLVGGGDSELVGDDGNGGEFKKYMMLMVVDMVVMTKERTIQ